MFESLSQSISELLNLPVDRARYVILFFLSFPLAIFLRVFLHYSYTSATTRHTVSIILGLSFGWMCFKWHVLYLIGFVSVGYILLITLPPNIVQRMLIIVACLHGFIVYATINFNALIIIIGVIIILPSFLNQKYSVFYVLLSTSIAHIYRLYTDYGGYSLDFTGPLMLLVQRVTYVAYAYHDGVARDEKDLSEDQKRLKISVIPSLLEYFSYNFCFMNILAGPTVAYKDYDNFITGRNITEAKTKESVAEPSPLIPTLKTFLGSMIAMIIIIIGGSWTDTSLLLDPNLHFLRRLLNTTIFCFVIRVGYYFTFLITESICNAGGLGFTGYDDEGKEVWDNAKNIEILPMEFPTNPRQLGLSWHLQSSLWIRRVFYEHGWGLFGSNIASAVWHGFYPGYYLTFLIAALSVTVGRKWRYLLWHKFQSPYYVKILYDISSTLATSICRDFLQATFFLLLIGDILNFWRYYYGAPIIIMLILAVVLPNKKKEMKAD